MNSTWKILLTTIGVVLVIIYVMGVILFFPDYKEEQLCRKLDIVIADSTRRQFVSSKDIYRQLRNNGLLPENKPLSEIRTHVIEDEIVNLEVVKDAQCCKMNSGRVNLVVRQREPRLRVIGTENYYVDADRQIMKATYRTACHVPIVTGYVTTLMAESELFDFATWLSEHSFWNAQIEQINVLNNREIELVPRVGSHTIILGSLDNYESKLEKLQVFYNEGLSKMGWQPWREVDLRFRGQVVCR